MVLRVCLGAGIFGITDVTFLIYIFIRAERRVVVSCFYVRRAVIARRQWRIPYKSAIVCGPGVGQESRDV